MSCLSSHLSLKHSAQLIFKWTCLLSINPANIALHRSSRRSCKSPVSLLGRTARLCPYASALYLTLLLEEQIPEAAAQTQRNAKCQSAGSP